MRFIFLLIFLLYSTIYTYSQVQPENTQDLIEDKIETIVENSDETSDIDYSSIIEQLSVFENNPIDINTATAEDLQQLFFLDEFQIITLLDYRKRMKRIISIYELQAIDGWDFETIQKILPYITLGKESVFPKISVKEILQRGKNELFLRYSQILEKQKGYLPATDSLLQKNPNARYLGSPYKLYTRYRFTYKNKISWGITGEKDPGEEFFKGTQKQGFDYYSAHFFMKDFGPIRKIAVGDYEAKFGQGLVIWSGLGLGKSPDISQAKKFPIGIKQYTSSNENAFLRGAATTVGNRNIEVTMLYSRKHVDANVSKIDSVDKEILEVSSLQTTGYHTTPDEIKDKNSLLENIYGYNVTLKTTQLRIGTTGIYYTFDKPLIRKTKLYNQFDFQGKQNFVTSIDYQTFWKSIVLFGEVARSENGGMAFINASHFDIDPRLQFLMLHRYYQKNFQNIYANAFSESSKNANENGFFYGVKFYPHKKWQISAYYDIYRFEWLNYNVDAPSEGSDYYLELKYIPSRNVEMYWRLREKIKYTNKSREYINEIINYNKRNLRYHISYKILPDILLKNRIEFTEYIKDNSTKTGYVFYQDVAYSPEGKNYSLIARYALFDCSDYEARIYAYENDVLYSFSIPAYYGRGSRFYIMLKWKLIRNVDLWLRYAQFLYNDRDVISSGLNEIQGNKKSEMRFQLRFKF